MTATVTLRSDSPRAEAWRQLYGETLTVPILSPIPQLAMLPGRPGPCWVYMLDVGALSPDVRERLAAYCAETFGETIDDVRQAFKERAPDVPLLLEEDLDVTLGAVELLGLLAHPGARLAMPASMAPPPPRTLFGGPTTRGQG
jgi:hypothetical protein